MHYGAFLAKFNRIRPPGGDASVTGGDDRYGHDGGGRATWDAQAEFKGLDVQGALSPVR